VGLKWLRLVALALIVHSHNSTHYRYSVPLSLLQVAVGALILGKAVSIADVLPAVNRYPDKPLAYNVIWKTVIYFVAALVLHYLERLIDFWKEAGGFVAGHEKLLAEMVWPHFWAIQITLFVLILYYCVMREIARAIGPTKLREMFFGPPAVNVV
jgi:hypothetical protein